MEKYHIAYHLVDHCNLKCAGCNHFSPLAEERFADVNIFEKNIKRLTSILNVPVLNLLGGEPLLHPNIEEFLIVARKYVKNDIFIWTNGLLLSSMNKSFWDVVNTHNIFIKETNYGIIENKFQSIDKRMYSYHWLSHKRDASDRGCPFYEKYDDANMMLDDNGYLHLCTTSATIHHYNKYYGTNLELVPNKDYIDIYKHTRESIILAIKKFRRRFCDYCRTPIDAPWRIYKDGENAWRVKDEVSEN